MTVIAPNTDDRVKRRRDPFATLWSVTLRRLNSENR
jgi:hypothetical protein